MATERRCSVRFLVFGASMREGSMNDTLASLAATVLQEKGGSVERATMADFECPPYDTDVEVATGIPAGAQRLHDKLLAADGFVIASPEYNASMPGVLKNTIECFIDLVEASKHYPHIKKQWVEFLGERPDDATTRVELGATAAV
jgi:multimeric flavodoxin WrbA